MSTEQKQEIVYLRVDEILIPEERVTSVFDSELYEELKESIRQQGILQPLLIGKVDNKYVLIDGLHRLMVAKELGIEKVPCLIKEMTEDQLLIENLIVNRMRGKSNPAEEAKLVKKLIDEYGYSLNMVAEKLGISRTTAEKYYQIATNCIPEVLDALSKHMISVGCAYWLSFIDDKQKQREVLINAIQYGYTVEQCKEAARWATMPEPPPGAKWVFTEGGKPVRVVPKLKAFPCEEEVEADKVIHIPVKMEYYDLVKEALLMLCREVIQPQPQQQVVEQPQVEMEEQPPPVTEKPVEKKSIWDEVF